MVDAFGVCRVLSRAKGVGSCCILCMASPGCVFKLLIESTNGMEWNRTQLGSIYHNLIYSNIEGTAHDLIAQSHLCHESQQDAASLRLFRLWANHQQ